jgi:hypothetical protein
MIAIFAGLRVGRGPRSACLTGNTFDSSAVPKEPFRTNARLEHCTIALSCAGKDFDELHIYDTTLKVFALARAQGFSAYRVVDGLAQARLSRRD